MSKKDESGALDGLIPQYQGPPKKRKSRLKKNDPMVPLSISIRKSELEEFKKTVEKTGFTRSEVGRYAIKYFMKNYNEGKIELKTKTVEKLQEP